MEPERDPLQDAWDREVRAQGIAGWCMILACGAFLIASYYLW